MLIANILPPFSIKTTPPATLLSRDLERLMLEETGRMGEVREGGYRGHLERVALAPAPKVTSGGGGSEAAVGRCRKDSLEV